MIEHLKLWLSSIQCDYGVNPIIFAIIYLACVIPFWLSIYKIITGIKNKRLNQVMTFGLILGISIIAPFVYVAVFGYNLPFWFWIVAAAIIAYSAYSVLRRIKNRG